MAGLGETCTHVAAVLFFIEASGRVTGTTTCTQQKCEWIVPSFQKEIPYLPVKEIDFTSARRKKTKLECQELCKPSMEPQQLKLIDDLKPPSESELKAFFEKLNQCNTKPAILSTVPEYALNYVPKSSLDCFPSPLQSLFQPKYMELSFPDLLTVCETAEVQVTAEMAKLVERETRKQSSCKLWFTYRAGRITASRMKYVCHTDPTNPSQSLVKSICYPEAYRFSSKATDWGCKHKQSARQFYIARMEKRHEAFKVAESGLVLTL
jgi:hypothetical protein